MKQKTASFRYFKNSLYMHYKRFNEDEKLSFIDYMNNARQRTMREEYNSHGLISRRRHMILNKNRPRLDQYFDDKGNCFLTIWLNSNTLKEIRFFSFIDDSKEIESLNKLRSMWLNKVIKNIDNTIFIIRSEEQTSELQSRFDLVCRLLLEKQNIDIIIISYPIIH